MLMKKSLPADKILSLILASLEGVLTLEEKRPAKPLSEETPLLGPGAVIESIGLVSLLADLEQRLERELGAPVTLASELAFSQKRSPFRTVASLAEYIGALTGGR